MVVVATLGGLLFGYDTGVVNGALAPMVDELGLTQVTEGLVTGVLLAGAAVGALLGGRLADRAGRRAVIKVLSVVFFAGTIASAAAPDLAVMLVARFLLGLAVGGSSVVVPMYLAELAPTERRGSLTARNELNIVVGQAAAFAVNAVIGGVWGEHDGIWRVMLVIAALPAVALFVGVARLPESPRWLLQHGDDQRALAVLELVRPRDRARAELAEVRELAREQYHAQQGGWADLAIRPIRRLVLIGIGLAVVQQATGINSIMYYGTQLLTEAGFASDVALTVNVANGVVSIGATLLGFTVINRYPRRRLLVVGLLGTTSMHLSIALAARVLPEGTAKAVVILLLVVTFVGFMQACLGLVIWTVLAEIFPLRMRGFGMGLAIFCLWVVNATIAFAFPSLVAAVGIQGTFLLFGLVGVLCLVFVLTLVPETADRSLEELEADLAGDVAPTPPATTPPATTSLTTPTED